MTASDTTPTILTFDNDTRALVRLSARIAAGSEIDVQEGLRETEQAATPDQWIEELMLQSYLFCGFPRVLNAMRIWVQGRAQDQSRGVGEAHGPLAKATAGQRPLAKGLGSYVAEGEATCRRVYGPFYEALRRSVADLHPELDFWMVAEGYGKVLSRPQLDLGRRELCIVAACAASGQDRQLHSHLHGAINVGVPPEVVGHVVESLQGVVLEGHLARARRLWQKVAKQ